MSRRRVGWLGVAFAFLLLLSSSMVSPPLSDQPLDEISAFYSSNRAVVIVAQIIGVFAAIVFALFVTLLATVLDAPQVKWTGLVVAAAAAVTSVPLIALASLGANADPGIARWTDLTDAVLFLAIAVFLGVLAGNGALPSWIRGLCVIGAGLTLVRGYLGFEPVFTSLDVIAPLSFLLIILVLAGWAFRTALGTGGALALLNRGERPRPVPPSSRRQARRCLRKTAPSPVAIGC